MILGVDVSHWQGKMDWKKAKSKGVRFAMLKATEGKNGQDDRFIENYERVSEIGIVVGVTHYILVGHNVMEQYENILETVGDRTIDVPIAVDCEETGNEGYTVVQNTKAIRDLVALLYGYKDYPYPMDYTRKSWWDSNVSRDSMWKNLPLWVAYYWKNDCKVPTDLDPKYIPEDWAGAPSPRWLIHQYCSRGTGYGESSSFIDLDVWNEAVPFPGDPPVPPPSPLPDEIAVDLKFTINGVKYSGTGLAVKEI